MPTITTSQYDPKFHPLQVPEKGFYYHQRIFDRVCAGDAEGAQWAMREHLIEAWQTMLRYATQLESPLRPRTRAAEGPDQSIDLHPMRPNT